uniref:HID1 domain-containing protein n=1 Tax=Hemiselmis andersenii TaxID=464988 RepID=A0A6U4MU41_HEMAN|mmetsp:Transcript_43103/g.100093  ORF Transcript_43103/g.100093 Transcript_43103/m.100093 type:complete len:687 (+) Transcript_43103:72-2132(+)
MGGETSKMSPAVLGAFGKMAKQDCSDDNFWGSLLSTPSPITAIPADAVRKIVKEQPANVARLSRACVGRMHQACSVQDVRGMPPADRTAVLNCTSMLTSLLPVLFEGESEHGLVETVWWKGAMPGADAQQQAMPLAEPLMSCILCLLLRPGIGCEMQGCDPSRKLSDMALPRSCDKARTQLLKLLLVTCSQTLYVTPDEYKRTDNRWLRFYSAQPPQLIVPIVRTWLATIFSYDPVGMGIPYSSAVVTDSQEEIVDATLHALITCLDYTPPSAARDQAPAAASGTVSTQQVLDTVKTEQKEASGNSFREALRTANSEADVSFMFRGMSRLLNNPSQASATYFVGSIKEIGCTQELLIVLWKLIDENKDFLAYILRACDVNEIVVPVVLAMFEARKDPSKIGLIHISTFVMLLLSGERNFCVNLNAAFIRRSVKDLPQFTGNNADLIYIVYHKLITEGPPQLESLYDCFLTTMSNISPYIKTFSLPAASRAASLFELFANRNRLLRNDNMPRYLVFLLEIFNNAIQYQYEGNPHLTYQVLRRKKVFAQLTEIVDDPTAAIAALPAAPDGSGGKGFKPTVEWVKGWADQLPMQPCLRLLQHLLPQLEEFCTEGQVNDEGVVVDFLKTTTMVGLLPVPHPILIRKYQQNEYTSLWFTTYVWGVVYLRTSQPPLFDGSHIKLFTISYVDA